MILDEKALLNPPPPYHSPRLGHSDLDFCPDTSETATGTLTIGSNNPYAAYLSGRQSTRSRPSFTSLPSHLLLHIVYCTFPQEDGLFEGDVKAVRQRRTLHWLVLSLRFVNRELYLVVMNVLRSIYLNTYDSLIRPPFSSDPFPSSNSAPLFQSSSVRRNSPYGSPSTLFPHHRELKTLDLFIAVLAHEEVLYDATSLHLSRHEAYKDIFELMQPRSRLEDLVAEQGMKVGLITSEDGAITLTTPKLSSDTKGLENNSHAATSSSDSIITPHTSTSTFSKPVRRTKSTFSLFSAFCIGKGKRKASVNQPVSQQTQRRRASLAPLPFESLTISFSTRKVGLMYAPVLPHTDSQSSLTVTGSKSTAYGGSTYGALGVSHHSRGAKRTIVEVMRERNESLEVCAQKLVRGLRAWMEESQW
ncbi:hypothetical protein GYMLUDRAFT_241619 [Collybiopsis luxurians FD-317 M1]|uniref:Uncharacterized protein n=1 Tax=Collybiopsis luxurians FD-317 M1 TaxID=944289 RepID=A0A0D0D374_9AGAR|nr:hypothetical protein GYMLUDRAFT_241619 [Collybiopsis luxurians FD-317 M1]